MRGNGGQRRGSSGAKKNKVTREQDSDTPEGVTTVSLRSERDEDGTTPAQPKPEHFVEAWNDLATHIGRPKVAKLTSARKQVLKARIANHPIEEFHAVFGKVERSDFLAGRTPKWSGVTFDWLIKQANFIKVLEGNYDR